MAGALCMAVTLVACTGSNDEEEPSEPGSGYAEEQERRETAVEELLAEDARFTAPSLTEQERAEMCDEVGEALGAEYDVEAEWEEGTSEYMCVYRLPEPPLVDESDSDSRASRYVHVYMEPMSENDLSRRAEQIVDEEWVDECSLVSVRSDQYELSLPETDHGAYCHYRLLDDPSGNEQEGGFFDRQTFVNAMTAYRGGDDSEDPDPELNGDLLELVMSTLREAYARPA